MELSSDQRESLVCQTETRFHRNHQLGGRIGEIIFRKNVITTGCKMLAAAFLLSMDELIPRGESPLPPFTKGGEAPPNRGTSIRSTK